MTRNPMLRAARAALVTGCALALGIAPAADAASHHKVAQKPVRETAKKPTRAALRAVGKVQLNTGGLGDKTGLGPSTALAAMTTAIGAAPSFYAGRSSGCIAVTPVIAEQQGQIMAGNFRDTGGNCYVWLNLQYASDMTGSEICKITLHELGHLNGLQHSADVADVMYSLFDAAVIPAPCQVQAPAPAVAPASGVRPARGFRAVNPGNSVPGRRNDA